MRVWRAFAMLPVLLMMSTVVAHAQTSDPALPPVPPPTQAQSPDPRTLQVPQAYQQNTSPAYPGAAATTQPQVLGVQPMGPPPVAAIRLPPRLEARLRLLDSNLGTLGLRGKSWLPGIGSIVAGGITITVGAIFQRGGDDPFSTYMYLLGSVNVARGLIDMFVIPNAEPAASEFARMPRTTRNEVRAAMRFGEDALKELAFRHRLARYLDASLFVASGALAIPLYLAPNDFEVTSATDIFIIAAGSVSIITGIVTFIIESDVERRWKGYQELVETQREERQRERAGRVTAAIAPIPQGAIATATGHF